MDEDLNASFGSDLYFSSFDFGFLVRFLWKRAHLNPSLMQIKAK